MKAKYSRKQIHAFDKKNSMMIDYNKLCNRISEESNGIDTINRNSGDVNEYFVLDEELVYRCAGSHNNSELSSNSVLTMENSKQSLFHY